MAAEHQAQGTITILNPNDVLLGRGSGFSQWQGNMQMRELIETQREEYVAARNKHKSDIAEDIVNKIQSLGGRFLRLDESAEEVEFILEEGTWIEVERDAATEKVKQCLRQKRKPPEASKKWALSKSKESETESEKKDAPSSTSIASSPAAAPESVRVSSLSCGHFVHSLATLPPTLPSALPSTLPAYGTVPTMIDPLPFLFQATPFFLGCSVLPDPSNSMAGLHPAGHFMTGIPSPATAMQIQSQGYARTGPYSLSSGLLMNSTDKDPQHYNNSHPSAGEERRMSVATTDKRKMQGLVDDGQGKASSTSSTMETESSRAAEPETEAEMSDFLLSFLALSGRPKFTDEQEAREKAEMVDAERAKVLSDMFGKNCAVDTHESKKPRRDLDSDSIDFLVKQMRAEIRAIPDDQKRALTEASVKARPEEFSDERLVKFLRCEGMNTKVRFC